jgi:hypothetical protein
MHVGTTTLGGYLLAMGADQGPLGATIGAVAGVAFGVFSLLTESSLDMRQRYFANACIIAAIGTAAITAFLAHNIISDVGLVLAGGYYALSAAVNLYVACVMRPNLQSH